MRISTIIQASILILVFLLPACSHYRLGVPGQLPFQTLYIPPVENLSYAPEITSMFTQQLIFSLQRSQEIKIVQNPKAADATLQVVVYRFEKNVSATQASDTVLGESFNLTLSAYVTLKNNHTNLDYFANRPLFASQQAFVTGGYQPAQYEVMPVITKQLADKVRDTVISVW